MAVVNVNLIYDLVKFLLIKGDLGLEQRGLELLGGDYASLFCVNASEGLAQVLEVCVVLTYHLN